LKSYKSPGNDHILAELIQAGGTGNTLCSEIHRLINCIWNKLRTAKAVEELYYCTYSKEG
jgi:hypothetical protein